MKEEEKEKGKREERKKGEKGEEEGEGRRKWEAISLQSLLHYSLHVWS